MTASLPMYDTAVTAPANDRFWTLIRTGLGEGPKTLDRSTDPHETWEDPALVLSQTCGLPYRSRLHDRVGLVGTPDYGVPGCPPGYYCSVLAIRISDARKDLREFHNSLLARNDARSQSGWAAVEAHLSENNTGFSFAGQTIDTGSHAASARAVAGGDADIAAIDAVTWSLMVRDTEITDDLRIIAVTRPTPGLPLITAASRDANALRDICRKAVQALSDSDRDCLMIRDIVWIPAGTYLEEPLPPPG
ncbi:PhnD/SsuA/transferrin family substrate-binding protein [uncultured Roseobacter sp.]|uniref:phosphate/phosphite/phosphonate ABC transporter substrate-binding protein n=1 Tax=uncultured Roseobacter sp. TaxID=114847 RepID=UPI002613F870|nr:PhnD/SsuA/transferrin family substrate-binding protein [uncultured Roseobacter sp.]